MKFLEELKADGEGYGQACGCWKRASERIALLEALLQNGKTEDCWCPMGIGHPSFSSHTRHCQAVSDALHK